MWFTPENVVLGVLASWRWICLIILFVLNLDQQVRIKAFDLLKQLQSIHGENIPRALLEKGFEFDGRKVPLIGPQGMFKSTLSKQSGSNGPAILPEIPISITTAPISNGL